LVRKVAHAQGLSEGNKIAPKHYDDISRLEMMADLDLASSIWLKSMSEKYPYSFSRAIDKLKELQRDYPEWVVEEEYSQQGEPQCQRCEPPAWFPLASKQDIFNVLGYV